MGELNLKEAIHIFENSTLSSKHFTQEGVTAAYVTALAALYKAVPKKAKMSDSGMFYICPECNRFIRRFEQPHGNNEIRCCKWCGQHIEYDK